MSESYTAGGDTWQPLVGFDISGQTFQPLESHVVSFIDLDLWLFSFTPPLVYLTECNSSHEPIGPTLATGHIREPLVYLPPAKRRVRFQLDTLVSLQMGTIYAIHVRKALGHIGADNQWLYDKDDATYPRGHIIFSDDGGSTWVHLYNNDFMFVEFGNPPLPKPDPVSPIANFACLALYYLHNLTSITFTLATSVPCHLDCYYTEIKPLVHPRERVIRGARLLDNSYHCFVAWKLVEQTELGDTLYHTFEMPNWTECQTKWFTFRGTVNEVISPSIGPIFTHHHTGLTPFQNLSFEDYPFTEGIPPHWKPEFLNTGKAAYFRDTVNVHHGLYSCKVNSVGLDFVAQLVQYAWLTPHIGQTLKFTFNWFGGGRMQISIPFWTYSAFLGSGWHTRTRTVTILPHHPLWFIKLGTGGPGSAFTQLSWDNITIEVL